LASFEKKIGPMRLLHRSADEETKFEEYLVE